jgi:hypothetical protein
VEQFHKLNVVVGLLEVLLQKDVDARLENEGIVDGNHTNTFALVPTRLSTTGNGSIHDIIRNQEEGLELFIF